ncbi:MAG TPA: DUF2807 domain-containing protein [Opitutaceae bacterium]|nr:DUF2807 domain-containing protein [Opitutaceae bacterium]
MNRIAIIFAAATVLLAGCHRLQIKGDGVIKTEDRSLPEFSAVDITGGYEIKWSSGKPSLSVSTDENLLPLIRAEVSSGTLQIDTRRKALWPTHGITLVISSATLSRVQLTGGNRFKAGSLSGSQLTLDSTGASEITVDGSVTSLDATMTGASKLNAKSLQVKNATLWLTGASEADVNASDALKVTVAGAASVTYSGSPRLDQRIAGAGSVRHRE